MKMDALEIKTPLKIPKRYRKGKKSTDDVKVEEFMSFGPSSYFKIEEEDGVCQHYLGYPEKNNQSSEIENRIDGWLKSRDIIKADPSVKKELYFEARRTRVNSISFISQMKDLDSTQASQLSQSNFQSPSSLQLTPENSKISQKRSTYASMLEITTSKDYCALGAEDQDESPELPKFRRFHTNSEGRNRESVHYQEHSLRELSPSSNKNF